MKVKPKGGEDWRALLKRQLVLIVCGVLGLLATGAANKLLASDLMKVEKDAAETAAVVAAVESDSQVVAWDSFDTMVRYYEDRVEALEAELLACEEEPCR